MFETVRRVISEYDTHDPEQILHLLGVKVFLFPMEGINEIFREIKGIPMVFVNSNLSEQELPFVMAHELGHCLLHKNINRLFLDRCTHMKTSTYENQSNLFAACLLHPNPQDVIEEGDTFEILASKIGVPIELAQLYFEESVKETQ